MRHLNCICILFLFPCLLLGQINGSVSSTEDVFILTLDNPVENLSRGNAGIARPSSSLSFLHNPAHSSYIQPSSGYLYNAGTMYEPFLPKQDFDIWYSGTVISVEKIINDIPFGFGLLYKYLDFGKTEDFDEYGNDRSPVESAQKMVGLNVSMQLLKGFNMGATLNYGSQYFSGNYSDVVTGGFLTLDLGLLYQYRFFRNQCTVAGALVINEGVGIVAELKGEENYNPWSGNSSINFLHDIGIGVSAEGDLGPWLSMDVSYDHHEVGLRDEYRRDFSGMYFGYGIRLATILELSWGSVDEGSMNIDEKRRGWGVILNSAHIKQLLDQINSKNISFGQLYDTVDSQYYFGLEFYRSYTVSSKRGLNDGKVSTQINAYFSYVI
ncbi:MAG: hypothetical protein OCD01_11215 [Fibrobacterales bacterium]